MISEENRKEIIQKWEDSGILDGLKGGVTNEVNELFCCKSPVILKEELIDYEEQHLKVLGKFLKK